MIFLTYVAPYKGRYQGWKNKQNKVWDTMRHLVVNSCIKLNFYFFSLVKPLSGPGSASKAGNNSLVNKSDIFDGLEEDEQELDNIFVPRSSVKKLVLKPKATSTIVSSAGKLLSI